MDNFSGDIAYMVIYWYLSLVHMDREISKEGK